MEKVIKDLQWNNFIILTVAGIINSIGVTFFLAPVKLYDSGISGTSMLLNHVFSNIPLSIFLIVLNIPLFLIGYKKQGLIFTIYSVFAVIVYSLSAYIITYILPIDVSFASPLAEKDLFLCAIFGGIVSGIGSGLTIRFGGAIDGIEVMAVVFAKKLGLTVGTFVMCYNVILYILSGVISHSWILPLYSIVTYAAALKTIDFIAEGLDKAKAAMIITTKPEEVCRALSDEFGQGITIMNAKGYYSDMNKAVIYFVVNRFQIYKMKTLVYEKDHKAFISITETSDALSNNAAC